MTYKNPTDGEFLTLDEFQNKFEIEVNICITFN